MTNILKSYTLSCRLAVVPVNTEPGAPCDPCPPPSPITHLLQVEDFILHLFQRSQELCLAQPGLLQLGLQTGHKRLRVLKGQKDTERSEEWTCLFPTGAGNVVRLKRLGCTTGFLWLFKSIFGNKRKKDFLLKCSPFVYSLFYISRHTSSSQRRLRYAIFHSKKCKKRNYKGKYRGPNGNKRLSYDAKL